jgi:hypothetical protein
MPVDDHVSLATLLDELRPLIVAARTQNQNPRYVLLSACAYDAVAAVKSGDLERGMPMIVLGLEIVRADESAATPRVF